MNNSVVSAYPGAKVRLAPSIHQLLYRQGVDTYVEPFSGMWNVGLQSAPFPREIYNDLDPLLATLFRALCDEVTGKQLHKALLTVPYCEESFMTAKLLASCESDNARRALYVWITLVMSINGKRQQFRGFSAGNERVIYENKMVNKRRLLDRLKNVEVRNEDALTILEKLNSPHVMAYIDPPYTFGKAARTGGKLYAYDFEDSDQVKFVRTIKDLSCRMIVSGYRNPLYDEVLSADAGWFTYDFKEVHKSMCITQYGEVKPTATECLWSNYDLNDRERYR